MEVNFNKIFKEDENFKNYAKETWVLMAKNDKSFDDFFKVVYSFYQMDMTPKQASQFIKLSGMF